MKAFLASVLVFSLSLAVFAEKRPNILFAFADVWFQGADTPALIAQGRMASSLSRPIAVLGMDRSLAV